jgi:hypothetical protein
MARSHSEPISEFSLDTAKSYFCVAGHGAETLFPATPDGRELTSTHFRHGGRFSSQGDD